MEAARLCGGWQLKSLMARVSTGSLGVPRLAEFGLQYANGFAATPGSLSLVYPHKARLTALRGPVGQEKY